jgi:ubiquinone/menaquinone biosynthesis C-methylase UbiE
MSHWKDYYRKIYPLSWEQQVKSIGFTRYHHEILDLLVEHLPKEGRLLEVGIGTGEPIALRIALMGFNIYGVDLAHSLSKHCKSTFSQHKLCISVVCGDAENLPYRNESFDCVYAFSTMWFMPDLNRALSEMFRIVRRDGLVIFDILNSWHITPTSGYWFNQFKRLMQRHPGYWVPISPLSIRRVIKTLARSWKVRGFFILLPTALPLIGEKGNLVRFSNYLSYNLKESWLRYFGSKLIYICRK